MINAETERRGDAEITENLLSKQVLDAAIEPNSTLGCPEKVINNTILSVLVLQVNFWVSYVLNYN
jgi:hypothetical protein